MIKIADIKWIKIVTDVFDDEKILLIESLPDADSIIVIWFKLLCLAGKQNNSGVFLMNGKIAYTDAMMATIFRRKESTVKLALTTFEQFGMIEIINGAITIPNWGKHQNFEQIESRLEYQKNYQREYRKKQKLLSESHNEAVSDISDEKTLRKHLRKQNVNTLDKIREDEIREDKKREKNSVISPESVEIIDYLNLVLGTSYKATTKATQDVIKARLKEKYTVEDFKRVIDIKYAEWSGDPKTSVWLRPSTLFGNKFESYLNQKPPDKYSALPKNLQDAFRLAEEEKNKQKELTIFD